VGKKSQIRTSVVVYNMDMINKIKDWMLLALWGLGIALVLIFLVNQVMGYYYKMQLLQSPCELCCQRVQEFECPKMRINQFNFNISGSKNLGIPYMGT